VATWPRGESFGPWADAHSSTIKRSGVRHRRLLARACSSGVGTVSKSMMPYYFKTQLPCRMLEIKSTVNKKVLFHLYPQIYFWPFFLGHIDGFLLIRILVGVTSSTSSAARYSTQASSDISIGAVIPTVIPLVADRMFVNAFSLHTFTSKSPGRW